jgi:predicted nuclease of predicted toxin-antitoxin system
MLRLAADENVNSALIRGVLRRNPGLDLVRVQDVGLRGADDVTVLAWAAREGRVLITYDVKTVPPAAYARITQGQPMPGVIAVLATAALGTVIDDLVLLATVTEPAEWEGKVEYLPLSTDPFTRCCGFIPVYGFPETALLAEVSWDIRQQRNALPAVSV